MKRGFQDWAALLAPGQYRITISEIRGAKRELTTTVEAGKTTAHIIDLDQP